MKIIFFMILGTLLSLRPSWAQDQYLNLRGECNKWISPFTKAIAIDNRKNQELLGYIPIKGYTGLANVRFKGTLADSLINLFIAQFVKNEYKEHVLILNDFFLNGGSSPSKFILSLKLFRNVSENKYEQLLSVDSIYQINGKDLFFMINKQICEIAKRENTQTPVFSTNNLSYSLDELYQFDDLEKQKLPMYITNKPTCGIYKDYAHFKMNTPDILTNISINISKKGVIEVDRTYKNNKRKVKLDPTGIYAVSDGNIILKITSSGEYLEIIKQGSDFYYDRSGSFSDQSNTFSSYYLPEGGRLGTTGSGDLTIRIGGPRRINELPIYRFRINYQKGNSVPVGLVKQ